MEPPSIELLTIGNEVLAGNVLDTNSHWLCGQFAAKGARVTRITVVPDEPAAIGEALKASLQRGPAAIVACGGLGPTADDLTLEAISAALGRGYGSNAEAYAMVRDFYARLHASGGVSTAEMTPARARMGRLPERALPLPNRVGAAPGALLQEDHTWIACLPGVPEEMKDIYEHELWPRLASVLGTQAYAERTIATDCWDESILAPVVDAVSARHPDVYVKSRAQVYGGGLADFVTLAAHGRNENEVRERLDAADADLRRGLNEIGIDVLPGETAG